MDIPLFARCQERIRRKNIFKLECRLLFSCRPEPLGLKINCMDDLGATVPYIFKKWHFMSQKNELVLNLLSLFPHKFVAKNEFHEILLAIFYWYRQLTCLRYSCKDLEKWSTICVLNSRADRESTFLHVNKLRQFTLRGLRWCLNEYPRQVKWRFL